MEMLEILGKNAAVAKYELQKLSTESKDKALLAVADALVCKSSLIIEENEKDLKRGKEKGMHPGLLDRLRLDKSRIEGMAEGLRQIAALPDPIGEVMETI